MQRERALRAARLEPTDRIPHWEHFSNPRYEEQLTGIDPWAHPQRARQRLLESLPIDVGEVPLSDEAIERVPDDLFTYEDESGAPVAARGARVRAGTGTGAIIFARSRMFGPTIHWRIWISAARVSWPSTTTG